MPRPPSYKQMLKNWPSSKLTTNEITRIKKSLWGPRLSRQAGRDPGNTQHTDHRDHRILWVGRDLWRSSSPTPLQRTGTSSTRPGLFFFFTFWVDSEGRKRLGSVGGLHFPQGSSHGAEVIMTHFFRLADDPSFNPCSVGS